MMGAGIATNIESKSKQKQNKHVCTRMYIIYPTLKLIAYMLYVVGLVKTFIRLSIKYYYTLV